MAVRVNRIDGFASDPEIAERLHRLAHDGVVEYVVLQRQDTQRRRLRVCSDKGTECQIALSREQGLTDGAVLLLEPDRAIVVRMAEERWLALRAADLASAVELGYFAGNLHWRVRFDGPLLLVALEGPEQDYLDRLKPFLCAARAVVVDYGSG